MKAKDVQNSPLLTDELKSKYGIFFTDKSIYIVINTVSSISIPYNKIRVIESNGITVTFCSSKFRISLWLQSVITSVNIF